MDNDKRRDLIFNLLEDRGEMSVAELAEYFKVTETTIRRDLSRMETNQEIIRRRGYAFLPNAGHAIGIRRPNTFKEEKQRIAKKAFELCTNVNSLALDSGTTVAELVHLLAEDHTSHKYEIVTCSLSVAYETCKYYHTYVPGGMVYPDEFSVCGLQMVDFFKNITADIAFLGSTGIYQTEGLTISYLPMVDIKRSLMKCSSKRVALVDSSKFSTRGLYTYSKYPEIDTLITVKTEGNAEALEKIANEGVEIILA